MKKPFALVSWLLLVLTLAQIAEAQIVLLKKPVRVVSSSAPDIFPDSWLVARINAEAELLQKPQIDCSITILRKALAKYPESVVKKNLDSVYVVHRLKYSGISASGTNSRKNIYLVNRGAREGYTDTWIERTFHAEFSSILLRNFPEHLDKNEWQKANLESFYYGKDGVDAVKKNKAGTDLDTSLHAEGFLTEYATSSLENDFNSFAKKLFLGNEGFWSAVDQYRRIEIKTDLVVAFYQSLDPRFSRTYFLSLAEKGAE